MLSNKHLFFLFFFVYFFRNRVLVFFLPTLGTFTVFIIGIVQHYFTLYLTQPSTPVRCHLLTVRFVELDLRKYGFILSQPTY